MFKTLFRKYDADGSGTITLAEFVDFLANKDEICRNEKEKRRNDRREKARRRKAALIENHEKLQLLHKLHSKLQAKAYTHTGKDFAALFHQFDVNNDESLTYEEFRRAIRRSGICDKRLEDEELQHVIVAVDVDNLSHNVRLTAHRVLESNGGAHDGLVYKLNHSRDGERGEHGR